MLYHVAKSQEIDSLHMLCCVVLYQVANKHEVGTLHLLFCIVSGCLLSGGGYSTSVVLCCIRLFTLRR